MVVVINQLTISPNTTLPTGFKCVKSVGILLYVAASAAPIMSKYFVDASFKSMYDTFRDFATAMVALR